MTSNADEASKTTRESVSALIDRFRSLLEGDNVRLIRLFTCSRCGAGVDEPCHGNPRKRRPPSGEPTHHTTRIDKYIRSRNTVVLNVLQSDLNDFSDPPTEILKKLESSKFYRHLEKLGRLP